MAPRKNAVLYTAAMLCTAACLTQVSAQQPGLPYVYPSEGSGTQSAWLTGSGTWKLTELADQDGFGSISTSTLSATVNGVGTLFTSELIDGQRLLSSTDVYIGKIGSIVSDTQLILQAPALAGVIGAGWQFQVELGHDYLWDATTGNTYWGISDDDCTLDNYLTINDPATGAKTTYEFETISAQCAQPYLADPCKHLTPDPTLGEKPWHVYNCNNPVTLSNGQFVAATHECAAPFTAYTGQTASTYSRITGVKPPSNASYIYHNSDQTCICECPYDASDKSEYISSVMRELFPTECEAASYVDTMLVTQTVLGPKKTHVYVGTYAASATATQKFRFFLIGDNVADTVTVGDPFNAQDPTISWDDYYVEINSGVGGAYVPFSIAGYKVQSYTNGLPQWQDYAATATTTASPLQPWVWALPYTCSEDVEPPEDVVPVVVPPLPVVTSSFCNCPTATDDPTATCCLAYNTAKSLSWTPTDAEWQVKAWHSDDLIWNNNGATNTNTNGGVDWNDLLNAPGYLLIQAASALGGPARWIARGLNTALKLITDGIPQNRLWGTNWCARGNEFTAYSRLAKGKSGDIWGRTDTSKMYGNPCTGESPKNGAAAPAGSGNYAGSSLVTIRDTYKAASKVERKKRKTLTLYNFLKNSVTPQVLRDYTIGPSVRQDTLSPDWALVELPNANVFNAAGKLTKAAHRLTRCRSVPNWIDTDFSFFTGGLQSVGRNLATGSFPTIANINGAATGTIHGKNNLLGFDAAYYNNYPYFGVIAKRAFDNVLEVAVTLECGMQGCNNFDTWCRQHDLAPVSYALGNKKGGASSKGTCHADGRGLFTARQYNGNYPFIKFANMLFGTFGQQPCMSLKLKCLEKKRGKCKNFGLKWKKAWGRKYKASKKEGKKFSGPIARNDMFSESICATLRTPGEGVDGSVMARIGNGICNCEYNNEWHGYDGGDCCPQTCRRPAPQCYSTTGTITVARRTPKIVTGTGTSFITQFAKGHKVYTINAFGVLTYIGTVSVNPTSNTQLTLTSASTVFPTASAFVKDPNNNVTNVGCTHTDIKCDLAIGGTVIVKSGTSSVAGVGTLFTQWFAPGHELTTAAGLLVGTIASIQSDVALTLTAIPSAAIQSTLSVGTAIVLDKKRSPFLGYSCKQSGCKPTAISAANVGSDYQASATSNYLLDGHIQPTFTICLTTPNIVSK